jgi:hypothetical protein
MMSNFKISSLSRKEIRIPENKETTNYKKLDN